VNARARTASGISGAGVTLAGILTVTTLGSPSLGYCLRTSSFAVPATAIGLVAEVPVGLVVTLVLGDLSGRIGP
jgi:hypothetical protein